jgi:toxin ParE1/3/4
MIWRGFAIIWGSITLPSCNRPSVNFYDAARALKQMPHRGRVGQKEGTRELVMAQLPYIIVYGVEPDMVHIFRVLHTAKNRP